PTAPAARRQERPLPAFEGTLLDGQPFAVSQLMGKRALLFFFDPARPDAAPAATALARIAGERRDHNFEVVGIAVGARAEQVRAFAAEHRLDVPIVDDPTGAIPGRVGLRTPAAFVAVDAGGYVTFASGLPPPEATSADQVVENQLREALRLPAEKPALAPVLGVRPMAPTFTAERLEGGERFDLSSVRGRPIVLMFFLYTCPHCHHAL